MPTYDWMCVQCTAIETEWRALKDREEPHSPCQLCGSEMTRLIGSPKAILRGQGWHNTDYTKTGPKERKR